MEEAIFLTLPKVTVSLVDQELVLHHLKFPCFLVEVGTLKIIFEAKAIMINFYLLPLSGKMPWMV